VTGFLEELEGAEVVKGPRCTVAEWLNGHPEIADEFAVALAGDKATTLIFRLIREKHGFTRSLETLSRHRRGDCLCPR